MRATIGTVGQMENEYCIATVSEFVTNRVSSTGHTAAFHSDANRTDAGSRIFRSMFYRFSIRIYESSA